MDPTADEENFIQIAEKAQIFQFFTVLVTTSTESTDSETEAKSDNVNVHMINMGPLFFYYKNVIVSKTTMYVIDHFYKVLKMSLFSANNRKSSQTESDLLIFYRDLKSVFESDNDLWTELKTKYWFILIDATEHISTCTDKDLLQLPLVTKSDLVCSQCGASVDIHWQWKMFQTNRIPKYTRKCRTIWRMWNGFNNTSLIEWIPEEVLKDILEVVLYTFEILK